MASAWAHGKMLRRSLGLVFSVAVCGGIAAAQQAPKAHPSPTPWIIVLPPKLIPGSNATLAVLDYQGRLMPNISVELSGSQKVTTDVTGRATFRVASTAGKLRAVLSAGAVAASSEVVSPEDAGPRHETGGLSVTTYPHVMAIHDRFTLEGSRFRGEPDLNHVELNGDPCLVLAASPVSLVALPGAHVPVGDATLHVSVAGEEVGQFPVSLVFLDFSGPKEAVNAGSTGQLTLRVHGSSRPLLLEVRNGTPAVIQLTKGNVQRLKTSGGDENNAPVEVKFVTDGSYFVSARLVSTEGSPPNLESAKKRLAEARKIAPGDWSARIDQVLLKIDRAPEDLPRIRAELRAMLDDKPAAPLASLLDSAWRELN